MKAEQIIIWVMMNHSGVDFSVNGETFQISNLGKGFWKRFFHAGSHPTRGSVSQEEIQKALDCANEFTLFEKQIPKKLTRKEFDQMVTSALNS